MTHIPDEAVQAALEQIHAYDYVPDENDFSNMKDAIKSALHHLSATCAEKLVDVSAVQEQCAQIAENFTVKDHIAHDMRMGIFPEQSKAGVAIAAAIRALSSEPAQGVRPLEEWHEDYGDVVWWTWDNDRNEWLGEPAYIGKPLDSDWPDYHTHWTPHPAFPAAPTTEAGK